MDQRLDDTDLIHGRSTWEEPDAEGNLVLHHSEWTMKRPQPVSNSIACSGCQTVINLAEYPNGRCFRCNLLGMHPNPEVPMYKEHFNGNF